MSSSSNEREEKLKRDLSLLYTYQRNPCLKKVEILLTHQTCFDLSLMGTGKTPTTTIAASLLGIQRLVVISLPKPDLKEKWKTWANTCHIPHFDYLSFNELAGVKHHDLKHPFLVRTDEEKEISSTNHPDVVIGLHCSSGFEATPLWKDIASKGHLLVVIDEFQETRNEDALRTIALSVLLKELNVNPTCYVQYISGTSSDKEKQALTYLTLMSILPGKTKISKIKSHHKTFNKEINQYRQLQDKVKKLYHVEDNTRLVLDVQCLPLLNVCFRLDSSLTSSILEQHQNFYLWKHPPPPANEGEGEGEQSLSVEEAARRMNEFAQRSALTAVDFFHSLLYNLFSKVVLKHMSVTMESVTHHIPHDFKKGYYFFKTPKELDLYQKCVENLQIQLSQNKSEKEEEKEEKKQHVFSALKELEISKIPLFESVATFYLQKYDLCKVILVGEYTPFFEQLSERLKAYHPLVLTGKTPMNQRTSIIRQFNQENDFSEPSLRKIIEDPSKLRHRVLLAQLKIAASSSEFDCKNHGLFQRVLLCSLSHSFLLSQQCPGRIVRADTRVLTPEEWKKAMYPYRYRYLIPTFRFLFGRGVLKDPLSDSLKQLKQQLKKQYVDLMDAQDPPDKRALYEQKKKEFQQRLFEDRKSSMFEQEPKEQKILMGLFSKGQVAKHVHAEQASHGVEFIHDYFEEIELLRSNSHFLHTSEVNREESQQFQEDEQKMNALVEQLRSLLT